jgi:hypothetical protein
MEDYKVHIEQTRKGNVGSSDSKMLQQIAELGKVPKSAIKRMAVIKGFTENENITSPAMRLGDFVETTTFTMLHEKDERWESNKCLVSEKYSRKNCGCLTHIDYWRQDDEKKVITVGEQKATKLSFSQARDEYKNQLAHHYLLAKEYADKIGYKVNILFAVYDTNGVSEGDEYDPSRLTVKQLRNMDKISKSYRLSDAMDIVDDFLAGFNEYYESDEVDANLLPVNVQKQFDGITTLLREIKAREDKVNAFKSKLYDFLVERGIAKIKCDDFSFTVVQPSESVSVDYKTLFAQEIESKKPRAARKLKEKYKKTTQRKGYVLVKLNENKD